MYNIPDHYFTVHTIIAKMSLEKLPAEVIQMIMFNLDSNSLKSFSQVKFSTQGLIFFFFWKFYPMPNHDIKNSTLASKVMFWTLPLIKCKTHQIWPTLKWKSWFFSFFSSFFTKNPCFPDKFYPSQKNPRNYNPMHIDVFFKIFTPATLVKTVGLSTISGASPARWVM